MSAKILIDRIPGDLITAAFIQISKQAHCGPLRKISGLTQYL